MGSHNLQFIFHHLFYNQVKRTFKKMGGVKRMHGRKKFWNMKRKEALFGLLFVTPEMLGLLLLGAFPLLFSLYLSFTKWDLVSGFSGIEFVGLDNFIYMFQDAKFYKALRNNIIFSVVAVPVGMAIALVISAIIHNYANFKSFFKVTMFIPYISTTVAVAAVWSALFHPSKGPINQMLMKVGWADPPKWLADSTFVLVAIIIITIWVNLGYKIIIYLAGLSNIPGDLYESADMDGANDMQKFWHITIPMLSPTLLFLSITTLIGSFKVFDLIKFLTDGGPNNASNVLVYYLYEEGFLNFRMGYASALSWMLFLIVAVLSSITWIFQKRNIHYQ